MSDAKWWCVVKHMHVFGPFRSQDKARAWRSVYGGYMTPMLPPDINDERTYEASRERAWDLGEEADWQAGYRAGVEAWERDERDGRP